MKSLLLHPDSLFAAPLLRLSATFCYNVHRQSVTSHRDRLKAHNVLGGTGNKQLSHSR